MQAVFVSWCFYFVFLFLHRCVSRFLFAGRDWPFTTEHNKIARSRYRHLHQLQTKEWFNASLVIPKYPSTKLRFYYIYTVLYNSIRIKRYQNTSIKLAKFNSPKTRARSCQFHVASICASCFFHIRAFRHIRPNLTQDMAKSVAVSLISSRLDYCNSLLYGSSQANIHKLQRVQNVIAKLVCASNARSSDALCSLHWLPINQRIKFKIASLTFKLLQHQSPSYLASLIIPYMPSRALRSQGQQLLAKPHVKTAIGSRALRVAAPAVWNSLPLHVRQSPSFDSFKRNLKTYLFTSHD